VTREVVGNALVSAAEEMSRALRRSAYSAIIYDMLDYSCALFARGGELVSQAENLPAQLGVMSSVVEHLLRKFSYEEIRPGDVFIANHPYRGATHTNDLIIMAPIYRGGELMAFAGTNAHHMDVGGKTAATEAADAVEIWQEGLLLPIVKLYDAGEPNRALFDVMEANVRVPKETLGDVRAQIAACRTGERRWVELCERYGAEALVAHIEDIWDYTECMVRSEISAMEPGTYRAEGFMDPDLYGTEPVRIVATVTVGDGDIVADFTGTDPQVRGSLNCPISSTVSSVWYAVRCMIEADIQQNQGCYRPVSVTVPEGSLLNPLPPAAVSVRHLTEQKVADVMLEALRAAKPARSAAGCSVSFPTFNLTGIDPRSGETYMCPDIVGGGMGGHASGDGMSAVDTHMGNCAMMSAEAMEVEFPVRVLSTELVPDSGGAGTHRGGLAVERRYQILAPEADMSGRYTDQTLEETRPWAVDGGRRGARAAVIVNPGRPDERELTGKGVSFPMARGDVLLMRSSGGGGWGDPSRRERRAVLDDLADGYVTPEGAARDYGFESGPDAGAGE
ncbi:MAG TPA: hydantoinase B/oxoprolinase family protein, partial [Thermoleophilia bacterium]|nr:hydantoinase B/oxoprolinase family protein [Thermoleophilia bacterium]